LAIKTCPEHAGINLPAHQTDPAALVIQGLIDLQNGLLEPARVCLEQAFETAPEMPDIHFAFGLLAEKTRDFGLARKHYLRAVKHDPRHAQARVNLGLLLSQTGALGQAEEQFRHAIDSEPTLPEGYVNLANLLQRTGRTGEAESTYRRALAIEPALPEAHRNLSSVLLWQNRFAEALQFALKAKQFEPDEPETYNTLGAVYKATQQIDKAIVCFHKAVDATPGDAVYLANLAGALVDARRLDEAHELFHRAIDLDAELPDAHYGLGMLQLLEEDFVNGWENYEWRWRSSQQSRRRHQDKPEWDGKPAPDQTLLIHCEQGLGDSIQFVRYLGSIARHVGSVVLECPPEARRLFESVPGLAKMVTPSDTTPEYDVQVPLLGLPRLFGATLETIPSQIPYLRPPLNEPDALGLSTGKFKVGLAWAGNPSHRNDALRSMKWPDCRALLEVDTVQFVSIQHNPGEEATDALGQAGHATDAAAHCTDLAATAAIVAQLDLVIAVDTAMAHLAGALGKPVWLLLPFAGEWRWLHDREDSPWYPTMRLFRQPRPGDWRSVIDHVRLALRMESTEEPLAGLVAEGLQLKRDGRLEEARLIFETLVRRHPDHADSFSNLGNILMALGKTTEALERHEQALRLAPDSPGTGFNLSLALLKRGDFANGWVAYENRLLMPNYDALRSRLERPRWHGESLAGQTLLVWAEQGFGDTIQFARFLPLVAQQGGRVLFECQPEVAPLIRCIDGIADVIPRGEPLPAHDVQCPLLSLPQVLGFDINTIPGNEFVDTLKSGPRIPLPDRQNEKRSVGLVWRGSRRTNRPEPREVPPKALAELTGSNAAQFFSLQKDPGADDLAQLGDVIDLDPMMTDFATTALLLNELDLVITIDTAVAHLAGTLGRPVWLLLPFAGEWRWLENRSDSPWYPTMRLFRQARPGDWAGVIAEVAAALRQQPSPAAAQHLANAADCQQQGQLGQAIEQFQQATAVDPENTTLLRLLADALRENNQPDEARACLDRAIELQPEDAGTHHELGLLLSGLGQAEAALGPYRRAIELQPGCADFHFNRGNAHYALGQVTDARRDYQRAAKLDPALAAAHFNLGQIAQDDGDYLTSAQAYKHAVDLNANYTDAMVNLGLTLRNLKETELAEECFWHILQRQPGEPMAGVNMAKLQLERDDPAAAEATCRSVLGPHPKHPETLLNLGVALQAQNRVEEAISVFNEFIAGEPHNPDGPFNLALAELAAGRWNDGWRHYEARWQTDNPLFAPRHPGVPRWTGEPLAGKRLLLFAEQGFGDTLQFCRYAPHLANAGARVVIECQPGLRALLQTLPGVAQVFEPGDPVPSADFALPMMSAPLAFGTTPETVPNGNNGRYLFAEPSQIVPDSGLPRIGVVWAGRSRSWADNRSLPAGLLADLLGACGEFAWFNLQLEPSDDARRIIDSTECITDLSPHISDFASTASLIESMDMVVTVDTAVAHLAGALGKPTCLLLPFAADWRWLLGRNDTPWYPNTRLFRQQTPGDWPELIDRVATELHRLAKG
jgi:tetratricopeptide (TPR) repeat protein